VIFLRFNGIAFHDFCAALFGLLHRGFQQYHRDAFASVRFSHKKADNGPNRFIIDSRQCPRALQNGIRLSWGYRAPADGLTVGIKEKTRNFA